MALCSGALSSLSVAAMPWAVAQTASELQTYQQRLEQLFQRLDQNNNQRLERLEVEGVPYLERHFERLDQGQRGYLTPADLQPAGTAPRRERANRIFRRADRNGDGRIERAEAAAFPSLLRHFASADRNGDGSLSRDELGQARRRQIQP